MIAMSRKPKFDLSNPGGQPKDWLQKGAEYDSEFSWWDDVKMVLGFIGLPLLIALCAGGFLFSLFQFAS